MTNLESKVYMHCDMFYCPVKFQGPSLSWGWYFVALSLEDDAYLFSNLYDKTVTCPKKAGLEEW